MKLPYVILAVILAFFGWWSTQPIGTIPILNIPIPNPLAGYANIFYIGAFSIFAYGLWLDYKESKS